MVKYETKGTEEESWTEKARNVYNGEGMRVRQYENGNSWARQYFYIGGALAISTDGSNENFVKSENILTPDGTILAALREAKAGEEIEGNAYWIYHYDTRGSATNLVGAKNGSLYRAEENIYDAFGNKEEEIKQSTSSVVNDIKFTGATLDNSGTYYLGSRHYDSNTGRFLQQDTFKGEAYSPWTQNLYTYTSNNPVNYVDPTGHTFEELFDTLGRFMGVNEKIKEKWKKAGKKLDTFVDTLKKSVPANTTKTASNRGKGYSSREEAIKDMEIEMMNLADQNHRNVEIWAFVYEYDGQFYYSNVRFGMLDRVSPAFVEAELSALGLLDDAGKAIVSIDFSHTHMAKDTRKNAQDFVVGGSGQFDQEGNEKPLTVSKEGLSEHPVYTQFGSVPDWRTIKAQSFDGMGRIPLNSFGIIAPIDSGGWKETERKRFGTW